MSYDLQATTLNAHYQLFLMRQFCAYVMDQFETRTALKPLDGFEAVWTVLKPAGPIRNPPANNDGVKAVQGSHCSAHCQTALKLSALTAQIL